MIYSQDFNAAKKEAFRKKRWFLTLTLNAARPSLF